jgi:ferredoxin
MRVGVDRDRCVGSGTCEALAPDVFEVDDDGVLVVLRDEPAEGEQADVRGAVSACPTRALTLDG